MIIRDAKGNKADVHMYMPYDDPWCGFERGCDIIGDWFEAACDELFVADVEYCLDYMRDWVDCKGDFADEEDADNNYREVFIDGEIYSNW